MSSGGVMDDSPDGSVVAKLVGSKKVIVSMNVNRLLLHLDEMELLLKNNGRYCLPLNESKIDDVRENIPKSNMEM